jgi:transposase
MATRKFILTKPESQELRQVEAQTKNVREMKRLQAVRMYGEGYPTKEIEDVVGCSWRALMEWCRSYRENGISGLMSKYDGQNAAKLTREQRANLKGRLRQYRPDQVIAADIRIEQGQFWTVSDLKIVVKQWYGVSYQSDNSYRNLLHQSGFSLRRPEGRYRSRPDDLTIADFEAELEKK